MKAFLILFLSSAVYADFINTNVNFASSFQAKLENQGLILYGYSTYTPQYNGGGTSLNSYLYNISSNTWTQNFSPCYGNNNNLMSINGLTSIESLNLFVLLCVSQNTNTYANTPYLYFYNATISNWTNILINFPTTLGPAPLFSFSMKNSSLFIAPGSTLIYNSSGIFTINNNVNLNLNNYPMTYVEKQKLLFVMTSGQLQPISVYDLNTNQASSMNFNLYYSSMFVFQEKSLVFIAGGSTDNQCQYPTNQMSIYDANTQKTSVFFLSIARCSMGINAISKKNLIFFSGGYYADSQGYTVPVNTVDVLDLNTMTFTTSQLAVGGSITSSIEFKSNIFFMSSILNVVSGCIGGYGIINPVECIQCSAGFYCPLYSTTANQIACPKGSYCPAGSSSAFISPTGTYSPNIQMSAPMICPAGFYCPQGTINPLGCTQGSYCPAGSGSPTSCPTGTYNNQVNSSSISDCLLCPTGTYNNFGTGGITICKPCSRGYYCPPGTSLPQPCGSNYYCPDGQNLVSCPAGTFYDGVSASDVSFCKSCPKGYYCAGKGTTAITCTPGTYTDEEKSAQCKTCPEGYYCQFGSTTPIICQMNTFADKGSPACTNCPNGQFTSGMGASACETCPSSKFSIDGWWCMSQYEKIVFLAIWIGSFISGLFTLWKVRNFYLDRNIKIIENGLKPSIKTFLFLEIILKKSARRNAELTSLDNDNQPILDEDKEKNKKIEETIIFLQSIKK